MTTIAVPSGPGELTLAPVRIGPLGLPAHSLGWDLLAWTARYLVQPDGPDAGAPWRFTAEQARFVVWFYAIDERGRFVYRYAVLRRMKGWGKDPVASALAAAEFVGPCRFGGWRADGTPIVISHPAAWVQCAAVNLSQTKNTMSLFPNLFSARAIDEYGIDLGKEIIHSRRGGRIEAVTSSPRALEGNRASLVIKNENHHWIASNNGDEMSEVIARNLAKSRDGARALAITNAHQPGEDSDAERDWDAWLQIAAGNSRATGILYDSVEAPPDVDLADPESLRAGIIAARGDADWLDVDRLIAEIYDPRTPPSMARRFYLNQVTTAADGWASAQEWDTAADHEHQVEPDETIVMFFDGSKSGDASGLVGCEVSTGHVFVIDCWEKPAGPAGDGWEVNRDAVNLAVRRAFDTYDVAAFWADVREFEQSVDLWGDTYGDRLLIPATTGRAPHPVAWDMRTKTKEFTAGAERFLIDLADAALTHDGDPRLRRHVLNARRRTNRWGVSLGKENRSSDRRVDLAVCAVGARLCRRELLASGALDKRKSNRTGRVWAF
ncbi:terminase [Longispora albida]|uniref:terminase n=1 Tax=Longispora albida TaxID=203523 RepID=UPI001B7FC3C7|nr:terminase [Longispora albida]